MYLGTLKFVPLLVLQLGRYLSPVIVWDFSQGIVTHSHNTRTQFSKFWIDIILLAVAQQQCIDIQVIKADYQRARLIVILSLK